jgi:hypothetical protein
MLESILSEPRLSLQPVIARQIAGRRSERNNYDNPADKSAVGFTGSEFNDRYARTAWTWFTISTWAGMRKEYCVFRSARIAKYLVRSRSSRNIPDVDSPAVMT